MRKEARLITLFTCAAGAICLFIRWLQLSTAFEPETGLPVRGAPAAVALTAAVILYAAALFVALRLLMRSAQTGDHRTALRGRSIFYPLAAVLAGVVTIAAAVLMLATASLQPRPGLWRALALLAFFSGVSYPLMAVIPRRAGNSLPSCLSSLAPILFFCLWLVYSYMKHSADPIVSSYATETLATTGAALGFYYCAGYAFDKPRPLSAVYFSQLGAFFCIVTLADAHSKPELLLYAAAALMLLMVSSILVGNFEAPQRRLLNNQ